jgi:hypothetical protein
MKHYLKISLLMIVAMTAMACAQIKPELKPQNESVTYSKLFGSWPGDCYDHAAAAPFNDKSSRTVIKITSNELESEITYYAEEKCQIPVFREKGIIEIRFSEAVSSQKELQAFAGVDIMGIVYKKSGEDRVHECSTREFSERMSQLVATNFATEPLRIQKRDGDAQSLLSVTFVLVARKSAVARKA